MGPSSHSAAPGHRPATVRASCGVDAPHQQLAPCWVSCLESGRLGRPVAVTVALGAMRRLSAASAYARHGAGARALAAYGDGPSGRRASIDPALGILAIWSAPRWLGVVGGWHRRAAIRTASPMGDGTAAGGAVRTGPRGEMSQHQEQGYNKNPHAGTIGRGSKML